MPVVCLTLALASAFGEATPSDEEERPSKKEALLTEKATRPNVHRERLAAPKIVSPVSLRNVWTKEVLPVDPTAPPPGETTSRFLRCHFTNQSIPMDTRLLAAVLRTAQRFKSSIVEVVSAYRAPQYNLMLRKKGHETARDSQHPLGHAVDFRLPGLPTRTLLRFVRSLRLGGVGYYPDSSFVHADVGRTRFWRGH